MVKKSRPAKAVKEKKGDLDEEFMEDRSLDNDAMGGGAFEGHHHDHEHVCGCGGDCGCGGHGMKDDCGCGSSNGCNCGDKDYCCDPMDPLEELENAAEDVWMELFVEEIRKQYKAKHSAEIKRMAADTIKRVQEKWRDMKEENDGDQ